MSKLILVQAGCAAVMLAILAMFSCIVIHHPDATGFAVAGSLCAWVGAGWMERALMHRFDQNQH
jgi:hypothetical protein